VSTTLQKQVQEAELQPRRPGVWARLKRNKLAVVGLCIVILITVAAVFAPLLAPYDPYAQDIKHRESPPGTPGYLLGTDELGRDILSRLLYGARISLMVGLCSVGLGLAAGTTLGLVSGYYRRADAIIMRLVDIMLAFPGILLAIAIVAALGPGLYNVVIAVAFFSIPSLTRLVRGQVLSFKEREFVESAKSIGSNDIRILALHILPNCFGPIVVVATLNIGTTILSASALSFLGLGAQPPIPEWGAMIASGRNYIYDAPHIVTMPGLAIMAVVFGFNVLGDGLRDAMDTTLD